MFEFLFLILFFALIALHKPLLVVFSILTGNKQILDDMGNFCEKKTPWRDTVWTLQERGEKQPETPTVSKD